MSSLYDYTLPEDRIAQKPASPRDSSKVLIYKSASDEVIIDQFLNIDKYLPVHSVLAMNESKVLPCRVMVKSQKGPVELLVMVNEWDPSVQKLFATANKKLQPGEKVRLKDGHELEVLESHEKIFQFAPDFPMSKLPEILAKVGEMPLPRYIAHCPLTEAEKRKKYQTIFAKKPGSAAAPTASLHFTKRVFKKLAAKKIQPSFLTLHVGLGTFAPVLPEHIENKSLYKEHYEIPKETLELLHEQKKSGKPIIAVGTTATRSLESYAKAKKNRGETDLFILPPYHFKMVDGLITNFHVPNSSLMMLVEAFLQHKKAKRHLKELYEIALSNDFRFYSFGDSMVIL